MPRRLTLGVNPELEAAWSEMARDCGSEGDMLMGGLAVRKAFSEARSAALAPVSMTLDQPDGRALNVLQNPAPAAEFETMVFTSRRGKTAASEGDAL